MSLKLFENFQKYSPIINIFQEHEGLAEGSYFIQIYSYEYFTQIMFDVTENWKLVIFSFCYFECGARGHGLDHNFVRSRYGMATFILLIRKKKQN